MHNCHKCHGIVADGIANCPHCNAKQPPIIPQQSNSRIKIYTAEEAASDSITGWLLFDKYQDSSISLIGRAILFLGLIVLSILLMSSSIEEMAERVFFLHAINTPFHEAGHVIFRPFGEFITSLGGTLGQLLMPLICTLTLLIKSRDPFGAAVALWWTGENFLDIAPYINDARELELPLLGGNVGHSSPYGFHDWEYILTEADIIEYDTLIAKLSFGTGCVIMLSALCLAALILFKQYKFITE